ncbi:DUF2098 domain-containing protein [Methanoplanus sp. FWC-SCC4]|uniref:DUF2098 domain-containing protein n=1 Tax=Methanochimaera problematica TaxID=2609417 RepID=A0AA97I385_9EURY|nr:DUF2098 family protein [Methanoplanus sp. FWC-SCC4]WOF17085.1 DUF2098 domain-containing protein [Methanoplanus sp. FWC-SCC4]
MAGEDIRVGSLVRYPRTGTSGKVVGIDSISGKLFARVDTTNLRYRVDLLIPVDSVKEVHEMKEKEGDIELLRYQKTMDSKEIEEAFDDVTGVGAG